MSPSPSVFLLRLLASCFKPSVRIPTRRRARFVLGLGQARCDSFNCDLSKGDWCGFMLKQQVIIGLNKIDNFLIPPLNLQRSVDSLIQIDCKRVEVQTGPLDTRDIRVSFTDERYQILCRKLPFVLSTWIPVSVTTQAPHVVVTLDLLVTILILEAEGSIVLSREFTFRAHRDPSYNLVSRGPWGDLADAKGESVNHL
jgi:hypothetical protein